MKKKKILITLLPCVALPILISASCGNKVYNDPDQPNILAETPLIKLRPAKKIDQSTPTPSQPNNSPTEKKKQKDPTPKQPTSPIEVKKTKLTPAIQHTPASRLTPAKKVSVPKPNIDQKISNNATLQNSQLPNFIDSSASNETIKSKLINLDINGGFINTDERLNTDFLVLKKDDKFQLKFGNSNILLGDFDILIRDGQEIKTLAEFQQNSNKFFDIDNTGQIIGLRSIDNKSDSIYDHLIWLKHKKSNSYFSIGIKMESDKTAERERLGNLSYQNIKKIASYFSNIEDEVEKLYAINNYVSDFLTYDLNTYEKTFQLFGAAALRKAVCDGYARLFHQLATFAGFENVLYATGDILGEKAKEIIKSGQIVYHAWNYVKLKDGWYLIDPTWNQNKFPWHRNKYRTNYFLARPTDMKLIRVIKQEFLDNSAKKDLRSFAYEKEGKFLSSSDLGIEPDDTSDIEKFLRKQVLNPTIENDNYVFTLIFKKVLYNNISNKLRKYLGLSRLYGSHNKVTYDEENGYVCLRVKLTKDEVASKFADLNINNPTSVNVTEAKFISNKEINVTLSSPVENLTKENFKLNVKDSFNVTMNFADVDEIVKSNDNKTYALKLKNIVNLVTEQSALVDLGISHPSYQFNFNNANNILKPIQVWASEPKITYEFIKNKEIKFSGFTSNTYYSINNGLNWFKMPENGIIDFKIEPKILFFEKGTNGAFSSKVSDEVYLRQYKQPWKISVVNSKQIVGVNNMMEYCIGYSVDETVDGTTTKKWYPSDEWHQVKNNHINIEHPGSVYFVRVKSNQALGLACSDSVHVTT